MKNASIIRYSILSFFIESVDGIEFMNKFFKYMQSQAQRTKRSIFHLNEKV